MKDLKNGLKNEVIATADENRLAVNMGSGTLPVLATPAVAALMEKAACELVQPYLDDGITTVGTMINIEHLKATPCGAEIRAEAVLIETEGRKYVFALEAYDSAGLIAKGTHERFAVKAKKKKKKTEQRITK